MPLAAAQQRTALQRIAAWRCDPTQPVACPACNLEGLVIIDRSVRPYAEWYALSCAACGLDQTLHVPLDLRCRRSIERTAFSSLGKQSLPQL